MKQLIKKYAFKAALVAGLLTLSAGGMMLSAHLTKAHDADAVQTVGAASAPVIVLDAGTANQLKLVQKRESGRIGERLLCVSPYKPVSNKRGRFCALDLLIRMLRMTHSSSGFYFAMSLLSA